MRWNFFAGTALMPTFARVVLALAFIATGLHKIADKVEYSAEDAAILKSEFDITLEEAPAAETVAMNVAFYSQATAQEEEGKVAPPENDEPAAGDEQTKPESPAQETEKPSEVEEQPQTPPANAPVDVKTEDKKSGPDLIEIPAEEKPAATDEPAKPAVVDAGKKYHGLPLYQIAITLHNNNIPNGNILAWIAALTEFIGGILILVGLFSRVWGLGLAITMAMAFYLTSMQPYFVSVGILETGEGADGYALFNRVFCQLGLGLLALLIFLVGPGPLSLDRLIFRARREVIEVEDAKG